MKTCIFSIVVFFTSLSAVTEEWVDTISSRVDQDGIDWGKRHLQNTKKDVEVLIQNLRKHFPHEKNEIAQKDRCGDCSWRDTEITPSIFVFMSFSVPEQVWLSLSHDLESLDGVFVIRGLPENSFHVLMSRITSLKEKGFASSLQIDPLAFEKFGVSAVPTFVVTAEDRWDKIEGNISLPYALKEISQKRGVACDGY